MSSFVGTAAPSAIYHTPSGFDPEAVDSRALIAAPFAAEDIEGGITHGSRTESLPLSTHHSTALVGTLAPSFGPNDWYYRVHVLPPVFNLGNVVSDEIFTLSVWNGWLNAARTLESIGEVNTTGLSLSGQAAPPLNFAINQQRNYTLEVATLGPPTIDGVYTFNFDDSEAGSVAINGSRITAWALTPDYSQPVVEKLAWKTDRMIAWDGSQQRRALRIAPRTNVSFQTPMTKLEKQYIENQLFAWGALSWALPIWWDGQYLPDGIAPGDVVVPCDTVDRDFVAGGLAILILNASTYEVLQITNFTTTQLNLTRIVVGTWPQGSKLYPVRAARLLASTRITRTHASYAALEPNFQIIEPRDWPPATGLPTYRGAPVLEDSPDTDETAEGSYEREQFIIDTDTGAIEVIDTAQIGFPTNSHNWFLQGKTSQANFRALLYMLKGAQGEIWVPSYEADLTLANDVLAGDTNLECQNSGFGLFAGTLNREDIRIETYAGVVYYRRITGSVQDSPTTELVSINAALGVNVPMASVRRISFMVLSTLAGDEISIDHLTSVEGIALCSTAFRAVNHDI